MSFDFTTLVTDRTQSDVLRVRNVTAKIINGTASEAEIAEWNAATMKGAYNYTDLNRVTAAIEALKATLEGYGYTVPGYRRIEVPHAASKPSRRLPEGHTELKWIESTGEQYIDTEFIPNNNTRVVCDCEYAATSSASWLFGVRTASGQNAFAFLAYNNKFRTDYAKSYTLNFSESTTVARNVDKNKNVTTLNNSETITDTHTVFDSQYSLLLFAISTAGTPSGHASAKMKLLQIYDNGTLVRDYVPDLTDDGQVGLYDLVEGKFYPNAGTGVFLAGPRRVQLPDGYTQVEYIESTGTQHIDTKFKPNQDTRAVLDFQYTDTSETTWIFGVQPAWANAMFDVAVYSDGVRMHSGYGTKSVAITDIVGTSRIHVDKNKNVTTVNGVAYSAAANTFQSQLSALIFADNTNDGVAYHAKAKTFFGQIYDNGELFSDYIPVINSSGEGGLYDLLTGEFYGNAGAGSFIVGPEVEWDFSGDTEEKDPYLWYESDIPTPALMTAYLANVSVIRSVLEVFTTTPAVPADMERLTVAEANAIERILADVQRVIVNVVAGFARSNSFDFWSGNRPIPTAESDLGRNWEGLDAMGSTWANWQEATWYLLLYGNLKAEGVVE